MGCINGKQDINDQHPHMFQVANVNEQGELISHGHLEVAQSELVLYQRGKQPTIWPLRSLRKYGFDSEIFSFECGRRCPTGQGIYAFRCRRAEQLFNVVQQYMTVVSPNNSDFPIPAVSTGPAVQRRPVSQTDNTANVATFNTIRPHPTLSRPGSITSNGPVSPPVTAATPVTIDPPQPLEHNNNNHRGSIVAESVCSNQNLLSNHEVGLPSYANVVIAASPTSKTPSENYINISEASSHLYMNVDTTNKDFCTIANAKDLTDIPENTTVSDIEDIRHCYANIDAKELEHLRPMLQSTMDMSSVPPTPTSLYLGVQEVNYAELDLDPGKNDAPPVSLATPESPTKTKKSYATIDFNKTNALSQSINPRIDIEEGSRKTRHNSTISDVTTRHSNSLSD